MFGLKHIFHVTALVALLALGIAIAKEDAQSGIMIALCATALTLASVFVGILRSVWVAVAIGLVLGAICYWWSDTGNTAHPADRLFEFVCYATWFTTCGVMVATLARARRGK